MDELVQMVSQRTGLPPDQARAAAQAVLDFMATKLPPPVMEQVKAAMGTSNLGDVAKGLGGMFGQKKA